MPSRAPRKKTPHWSTEMMRHHPRQRAMASGVGVKMNPVWARFTFCPPTAEGM